MALKIVINKRFAVKVVRISEYLEKEWSEKAAKEFLAKVDRLIFSIANNPGIGSPALNGTRKVILTKHNKIYYRIKGKKVIFVSLFESKQNPQKNKYE